MPKPPQGGRGKPQKEKKVGISMLWKIILIVVLGLILLYSVSRVSFKAGWKSGAKAVTKLTIEAIGRACGTSVLEGARSSYKDNHGTDVLDDLNQTIDKL